MHAHTHTHTFNGPFSGTTRVGRYQKCKTNLDFTKTRDSEWQRHQLGHMQVCTLLQTGNHTSSLIFYRPDALPAVQQTASKHWRQVTFYIRQQNFSLYVAQCGGMVRHWQKQTLAVKWTPCCSSSSSATPSFESAPSSVTRLYVFLNSILCRIPATYTQHSN